MGVLRRAATSEVDVSSDREPQQTVESVIGELAAEWAKSPRRLAVATAAVSERHPTPDDVLRRAASLMLTQLQGYLERLQETARQNHVEAQDYTVADMVADVHALSDDDFAAWMDDWLPPRRHAAS